MTATIDTTTVPPADTGSDADLGSGPPSATDRGERSPGAWLYLASAVLAMVATTIMMRLWRATWSVPFVYSGDGTSSATYFKTVLQTGWYESQPDLGAPYGQHLHDFPFSDELQPMMIKVFGLFSHQWPIVFNVYYIAGFPLAAVTAVYFLRRCGLSGWLSVALAVLFAVAPYHFWRRESQYFLSEYWAVPLGLVVVLTVLRGEPIWGLRRLTGRAAGLPKVARGLFGALTGRGAATFLSITLVTLDGAYYGVFTAVLLAPAILLALLRTRNLRRFLGGAVAGALLLTVFVGAMLPDIIYEHIHGSDAAAFIRQPAQAETYALKFMSLILPAARHPWPPFAHLRSLYDSQYQLSGEQASLGLVGTAGFLMLTGTVFAVLLRRPRPEITDPVRLRRRQTFRYLSALTCLAFLASTIGGLGTLISFLTASIRGWNRMSILITLLSLAGLGVAVESGLDAARRRRGARAGSGPKRWAARRGTPLAALLILVLGVADQSSGWATPNYGDRTYASDDAFVTTLESRVPAGSMIYQTPYLAFPEGGALNHGIDTDQLKLFLHSTTLRWSGGGIKGRPQTLWPKTVSAEPAAQMTENLAIVGFAGIVVDRNLTKDHGVVLEARLVPYTGEAELVSSTGRWAYFSLDRSLAEVRRTLTPAERASLAAIIVRAAG